MKTAVKLGLIILSVLVPVYTQSSKDTLVLLDDLAIKDTHSRFFKSLQGEFSVDLCELGLELE